MEVTEETQNSETPVEILNTDESVDSESLNDESLDLESLNDESLNDESLNEETLNDETLNDENNVKETEKINSFKKILTDMTRDILTTFPELKENMDNDLFIIWKKEDFDVEEVDNAVKNVMKYCEKQYPERFFDILYQNDDMFNNDELELYLLPKIDFKKIWNDDISEKTKEILWKYLQLILFTVISGISDGQSFGDTVNLFQAINHDEFKNKLEETMENMKDLFEKNNLDEEINLDDMPTAEKVHEHVAGMMDGKLGSLAKEIAEETAKDMDINLEEGENISDVNDVFSKLLKDPTKLMSMVKNVGTKLDEKIKSGDIKESELLEEATTLMNKMKEMPGMGNMQEMLAKMGLGKKGKINEKAMQAQMQRNLRLAKQKEAMRNKIKKTETNKIPDKTLLEAEKAAIKMQEELLAELDIEESVYRNGPKAERSKVGKKKKKKGKKKK